MSNQGKTGLVGAVGLLLLVPTGCGWPAPPPPAPPEVTVAVPDVRDVTDQAEVSGTTAAIKSLGGGWNPELLPNPESPLHEVSDRQPPPLRSVAPRGSALGVRFSPRIRITRGCPQKRVDKARPQAHNSSSRALAVFSYLASNQKHEDKAPQANPSGIWEV